MNKVKKNIKRWTAGFITGGADNDPAGISTYSVAGASTGYSQLWLMVLAIPMLIAVQAMCARIGEVKKAGLISVIKEAFPKPVIYLALAVLTISNITTIGADISGVAVGLELMTGVKLFLWVIPVVSITWLLVVFANFKTISKYLLWLVGIFFCYILAGILARPNWALVLKSLFVPSFEFNFNYLSAAVGILGTTITPYLFFWQTEEEVENRRRRRAVFQVQAQDKNLAPGFIFSQIITIFIIISTATVLHRQNNIRTAYDAALALEPLAGPLAKYLFAAGIIGAGFLAIPVLAASTAYVVAETFGWKDSLSLKIKRAKGFYSVITLTLLVGAIIALLGIDPIKALFYSQILAGLLAPILIAMILVITNHGKTMEGKTNGWFDNLFGSLSFVVMTLASVLLIVQLLH